MARSIYVMPYISVVTSHGPSKDAKYKSQFQSLSYTMFNYGDEPQCIVGIVDPSPALDTSLTSNADVFKPPDNLDLTVSSTATRNAIRTHLEQDELPGTWVQTSTAYREIARVVVACCQFAQRYQGLDIGPWFQGTVHVSSNFSTLTAQQQQGIHDTAASFGFDQTAIVGTATIRDVLKNMADQYIAAGLPLDLAGPL